MTAADRALARAAGAAQRLAPGIKVLAALADELAPYALRRQAWSLVEEYDLLRHMFQQATLEGVISPPGKIGAAATGAPGSARKSALPSRSRRKRAP